MKRKRGVFGVCLVNLVLIPDVYVSQHEQGNGNCRGIFDLYSLFGRKNLEGKERKWKEICYFSIFGSLKKKLSARKWEELEGKTL